MLSALLADRRGNYGVVEFDLLSALYEALVEIGLWTDGLSPFTLGSQPGTWEERSRDRAQMGFAPSP